MRQRFKSMQFRRLRGPQAAYPPYNLQKNFVQNTTPAALHLRRFALSAPQTKPPKMRFHNECDPQDRASRSLPRAALRSPRRPYRAIPLKTLVARTPAAFYPVCEPHPPGDGLANGAIPRTRRVPKPLFRFPCKKTIFRCKNILYILQHFVTLGNISIH